jgi:pimeloyl-ACP methyl ester carboxylesterase
MSESMKTGPLVTLSETPHSARTVLLVHGSMDQAASFRLVAQKLTRWTVVAYDRRGWGVGRSVHQLPATMVDHVADLEQIVDKLANPIVVGHSYGALLALCAAARRPDAIRSVVAFEPPVPWLPWWPAEAPWERLVHERSQAGPAQAAAALLAAVNGRPPINATVNSDLEADGVALMAEMTDPCLNDPAFDPGKLQVPVLTAAGSRSLVHHRESSKRLSHLLPFSQFVEIEGAGHVAHITHAKEFAALVACVTTLSRSGD